MRDLDARVAREHPALASHQAHEWRPFRVAAVTSHAVQYQAPLFQQLAQDPRIDLDVFYGHDDGVVGAVDREFGVPVAWDRPLLDGYRSHVLVPRAREQSRRRRILGALRIVSHLRRGRYDAVIIHSYATRLSLVTYAAAWLTRTPVLLRTESHLLRMRPAWVGAVKAVALTLLFRTTAAFLVIGEANRACLARYGAAARRMFWTPYSVDNDYLSALATELAPIRAQIRREIGLDPELPVVAFFGKLIARKQVGDLVRAIALLAQRGHATQLLIVGDGPLGAALRALCMSLGVKATFAGFQNQTQLARHYVAADLLVLPSGYETWGLVINEAMACGLPVVTTTVCGAGPDLVTPGVTGDTYQAADCEALADCLQRLITNPELREEMGRAARERVDAYSYRQCAAGVLAALGFVGRRATAPARRAPRHRPLPSG